MNIYLDQTLVQTLLGFLTLQPLTCPYPCSSLLEGTMDLPPTVLLYQFSVTTASNVFYLYCSSMLPEIFESDSGNLNVIMKQLCFQCSHNSLGFPGQFGLFLMCCPWENKLWVGNMNGGKCDHICLSHVTWLDLFRGGWNQRTFYGSGCGSCVVQGFKLRFTILYIKISYTGWAYLDSISTSSPIVSLTHHMHHSVPERCWYWVVSSCRSIWMQQVSDNDTFYFHQTVLSHRGLSILLFIHNQNMKPFLPLTNEQPHPVHSRKSVM